MIMKSSGQRGKDEKALPPAQPLHLKLKMRQDAYCPRCHSAAYERFCQPSESRGRKAIKNVRKEEMKHPSPVQATIMFVENPEQVTGKLWIRE